MQMTWDNVNVLLVDLTTQLLCGTLISPLLVLIGWPTIFLYCLGFPLYSAFLLHRAFHGEAKKRAQTTANAKRRMRERERAPLTDSPDQ